MYRPPPRRRAATPPWPLWFAIIGIVLAGPILVARVIGGRSSPGQPPQATSGVPAPVLPAPEGTPIEVAVPTLEPTATPPPTRTLPPMPTPINVPRSSRYNPTPLVPDSALADRVVALLSGLTGRFGVAIKDLDTGRGVLIDPESEYPAASLFKLPVMYEVFKQRELSGLSFDEVLVFTERHVAFDLGTLDRPAGSPIVLAEALDRMITVSDNSSAVLLTDRVGAFNINRDMTGIGLEHTRILLDDLTTSPSDMLLFLEMLARGQGVSSAASLEMLQLMGRQQINDRIPLLLPPGVRAAHKTGNLGGIVHDVGVVFGPEATFAIAVLVADTPTEGRSARAIAEIASATYEYLSATRPSAPAVPSTTPTPTPTPEPIPSSTNTPEPPRTPTPTSPTATRTTTPSPGPSVTVSATGTPTRPPGF